jgi:hypothetical protein
MNKLILVMLGLFVIAAVIYLIGSIIIFLLPLLAVLFGIGCVAGLLVLLASILPRKKVK